MNMLKKMAVLAMISGTIVSSCKKDSVSSTSTSLGVKIQATNKSFSVLKTVSAVTPSFTWDTCFMNVSKIEFEAEKHEDLSRADSSSVHLEWIGPKKVDLFNLTAVIGEIPLLTGTFEEVSLKIRALKADAGNSPVFYLSGNYTNSTGMIIPISVIVNEDFEFRVKQEGTALDGTSDYTSLINLNLSLLMENILNSDLDSATLTNGKIIISSTSNTTLFNKINTKLSSCEESQFKKGKDSQSESGNSDSNKNNDGSGQGGYY